MEVVWGVQPAPSNCDRAVGTQFDRVCKELLPSVLRALQLCWEAFIPSDWRPTDPVPLPYHATISTEDLLDGGKRDRLAPLLKGKVVIYGAHIALVKDYVVSPVHGNVDGAFLHAMALDNLLTYGNRYVHRGAGHRSFHKEWTEFQPAVLMLFASFLVIWNRRRLLREGMLTKGLPALREADEYFLRWIKRLLIATVAIAGFVEFFLYSISPFNWLALLIVVHIAHWIEKSFFPFADNPSAKQTSGSGMATPAAQGSGSQRP
jgi:CHASE2 domain-containing sensor protein